MRLFDIRVPSFSGISLFSRLKSLSARSSVAGLAAAMVVAATVFAPASTNASTSRAPRASGVSSWSVPFLSLPFNPTSRMSILSGWYYSGGGGFHGGVDYINGNVNSLGTWQTFPVIAAADGDACGNCTSRQGNAVWVRHNIGGQTYYTYYGHLASIASGIPIGSQSRTIHVARGQFLGMAGDTGVGRGVLHLHFGLYNSASQPIDPYSIGKLRESYPRPSANPALGWFLTDGAAR